MTLDNARFYAILDTGYVQLDNLKAKLDSIIEGKPGLIQFRAKGQSLDFIKSQIDWMLPRCQKAGIPLILNDHAELAASFDGLGLHVGQDDLPVEEARSILGPNRILGLSTHSTTQIDKAIHLSSFLNYFAVGPVFSTPTKPTYTPVGLELVKFASQANPPIPFFCIGGIKRSNAKEVISAGGSRIVVVSDVLLEKNSADAIRKFHELLV